MSETLSYIESYFENQLTAEERLGFEERITADESFAQDVAFYVQTRQVLRQQLLQQKQQDWSQKEATVNEAPVIKLNNRIKWKKILAVAASVIFITALSLLLLIKQKDTPQELATRYVKDNFQHLGVDMGSSSDSLQLGIAAYNSQDYSSAAKLFSGVYAAHPDQTDALKYNGLVSLAQKDYDKAISHFQMLAGLKLYANPGLFYQAITLLQRNKPGDEEQARKLLQAVVDSKQEGNKEAQEWLKKF